MIPKNTPNRYSQTFSEGGDLFAFDDSEGQYIAVQPSVADRIRESSNELLLRILEAGTFSPLWMRLAEEELVRRGKRRPPSAG